MLRHSMIVIRYIAHSRHQNLACVYVCSFICMYTSCEQVLHCAFWPPKPRLHVCMFICMCTRCEQVLAKTLKRMLKNKVQQYMKAWWARWGAHPDTKKNAKKQGTAILKIIDARYQLSTVFSTSLLLENRWNHDNGRQLLWEWQYNDTWKHDERGEVLTQTQQRMLKTRYSHFHNDCLFFKH
jgi:hypothetical protein